MNARDLLELADELVGGMGEVHWRAAVGRAYFAAFHVGRRLLKRCGFDIPASDRAHSHIHLCLYNCGHPDVRNAGSELSELRKRRNAADYDLDRGFMHQSAADAILAALAIIELLEAVEATPSIQTQITPVIRVYERDVLRHVTWRPTS